MVEKSDYKALVEAGVNVDMAHFMRLDEASRVQVTDKVMTDMFKFITDKYNSIDFSEIEKSAGDYKRFKYAQLVDENVQVLHNIYEANKEKDGASKFLDTLDNIKRCESFLLDKREQFMYLYRTNTGFAQLIYTSMVSSMVYAVSALVAQTIRFVTLEDDDDLSVVYDEMNNAAKNIHVKNVNNAANSIPQFSKYIDLAFEDKKRRLSESVTLASLTAAITSNPAVAAVGVAAAIILLIPRIIPFIREVIYSIYFSRVNMAQAIGIQVELIRTNIETLETSGRGTKKVIARQRSIANKLEKLQNIIVVRTLNAQPLTSREISNENKRLNIPRNSEMANSSASGLLI